MFRVVLFLLVLFAILLVLRWLRQLLSVFAVRRAHPNAPPREVAGEMVRDPVCGTWVDRRLALPASQGRARITVCSEKCRDAAEASGR